MEGLPTAKLLQTAGALGSFVGALQRNDQANGQSERGDTALQPVTFRYKLSDPNGIPQFGLIASKWRRIELICGARR